MDQTTSFINNFIINKIEYFQIGFGILIVTWISTFLKDIVFGIFEFIKSRFYYSARLAYPDSSFIHLLEWVGTQKLYFSTREVSVMTRYQNMEVSNEDGDQTLKLLPSGTQWLFFDRHLISISRTTSEKKSLDGMKDDYLDLRIYFGSKDLIIPILKRASDYSNEQSRNRTKIFTLEPNSTYWECISCQLKREMSSVFLEKSTRNLILHDLDSFVKGKNWYRDTGVPYRRGYLLYGPPGTGKTSFILSIAGKFNKSISIMNMSKGINDSNINSIIQRCQKDTILVMEDIDAAFTGSGKLSFSALLNSIDGLTQSDGRILIMTTNHIDKLSPALIRPGRIDIKIKFDFATSYQINKMFKRFFSEKYHYLLDDIIEQLKNNQVSTAQLQGWFISHRNNPTGLLESCEEFIENLKSDQRQHSNFIDNNDLENHNNNEQLELEGDEILKNHSTIKRFSRNQFSF